MTDKSSRSRFGNAKFGATRFSTGGGGSTVVGKSTDGRIFSKAYGSHGRITVMDREAFKRAAGKADQALASKPDKWRKP